MYDLKKLKNFYISHQNNFSILNVIYIEFILNYSLTVLLKFRIIYDRMSKTNHIKLTILFISLSVFVSIIYKPLPNEFKQPWKYRFLCFGAEFINYYVKKNNREPIY
jgi:hypothetical protein